MTYSVGMRYRIRKDTLSRNRVDPAGFSLIELMIVVALLAIVALIALPSYNWAMQKSRRAEGKILLHTLMAAEERHYSNANRYTSQIGDAGIAESTESLPGRFYALSDITVSDDAQAVVITVVPQHAQRGDPCGSLTLDSIGRRGSSAPESRAAGCW